MLKIHFLFISAVASFQRNAGKFQSESWQKWIGTVVQREKIPSGLPFELLDYVQLIELTGKCIREDKAGFIEENLPNILNRLSISAENWLTLTKGFTKQFHGAVGHEECLNDFYEHQHLKRRCNVSQCKRLLA